jgi:hypothetical protein
VALAKHYHVHQIVDENGEQYRAEYGPLNHTLEDWSEARKLLSNANTLKAVAKVGFY